MAQIEMILSDKSQRFGDYEAFAISSKFAIHIEPSFSYDDLSDTKRRLIDTIWEKEQKRRNGKLHEGKILSAISFDEASLTGQFVPYKYYLAQLCDPSLKPDLKIVPVSISGVTLIGDEVIVARRAAWVAQYPGRYELAPSGGVRPQEDLEALDIKQQLLEELTEEVGIAPSQVKGVKYFTLVHDHKEDGIELCAEIRLKTTSLIISSTKEYPQIMALPCAEVEGFVRQRTEEFVPLSLILLKLKKLISS